MTPRKFRPIRMMTAPATSASSCCHMRRNAPASRSPGTERHEHGGKAQHEGDQTRSSGRASRVYHDSGRPPPAPPRRTWFGAKGPLH